PAGQREDRRSLEQRIPRRALSADRRVQTGGVLLREGRRPALGAERPLLGANVRPRAIGAAGLAASRSRESLAVAVSVGGEESPPRGLHLPCLEGVPVLEGPAIVVVVDLAREDERVHQRRVEEDLLNALQRAKPEDVPRVAGQIVAHVKT